MEVSGDDGGGVERDDKVGGMLLLEEERVLMWVLPRRVAIVGELSGERVEVNVGGGRRCALRPL